MYLFEDHGPFGSFWLYCLMVEKPWRLMHVSRLTVRNCQCANIKGWRCPKGDTFTIEISPHGLTCGQLLAGRTDNWTTILPYQASFVLADLLTTCPCVSQSWPI